MSVTTGDQSKTRARAKEEERRKKAHGGHDEPPRGG
jgi:hypothetical protein